MKSTKVCLYSLIGVLSLAACSEESEPDVNASKPDDHEEEEVDHSHPEATSGFQFEDKSAELGREDRLALDGLAGLAWFDFDGDGDEDLFFPGGVGSPCSLFENDGKGGFSDVAKKAGVDSATGYAGVAVADIDNDGDLDLYASAEGNDFFLTENRGSLFLNNGDGTFTDVYEESGIKANVTAAGAAFADINRDGYVDLFVASAAHRRELVPPAFYESDQLFLNNGDGTFKDITTEAGVGGDLGSCVATFSDYDGDNWIDLYVGVCNNVDDEATPFHLYRNNHDNTFTDVADKAGLNQDLGYWMAIATSDYDNDGDLDFFTTNYGPIGPKGVEEPHILFRNKGDGTYQEMKDPMWTSTFAFGATFADFDNDGWEDLYVIGDQPYGGYIGPGLGTPGFVYMNDQAGGFVEDPDAGGVDLSSHYTSGVARADYDQDGFVDLAVMSSAFEIPHPTTGAILASHPGGPVLLRNQGNANRSVTVRLTGTESNRAAIGAIVKLHADGVTQMREVQSGSSFISSESLWPTFGLGTKTKADVEVRWPSGKVEWFRVKSGEGVIDLEEGSGHGERVDL